MVVGMRHALQAVPNLLFQEPSLDVQFALSLLLWLEYEVLTPNSRWVAGS